MSTKDLVERAHARTEQRKADSIQALLDRLIAGLDTTYDLIYVDRDDRLTDGQVDALAAGDHETLWDEISEWESDSRWQGTEYELDQIKGRLSDDDLEHWDDVSDELRNQIMERDDGKWFKQLVSATPSVLMRVKALNEDHGWSWEPVEPVEVIDRLREVTEATIETSAHNLTQVSDCLRECSPEFSTLLAYWVFEMDVSDLYELPNEGKVTITNPELWLGNPFAGSGFITGDALECCVTVDRSDLLTDKAAFGYGINDIFGGYSAAVATVTATKEA